MAIPVYVVILPDGPDYAGETYYDMSAHQTLKEAEECVNDFIVDGYDEVLVAELKNIRRAKRPKVEFTYETVEPEKDDGVVI